MATVKYAAHISAIHGSIQNATYSRNRLGPFIKTRRVGIDRRTLAQVNRRTFHANAVEAWHVSIDPAAREAWNNLGLVTTFYNKASIAYHPTGFNLFVRMNTFVAESLQGVSQLAPAAAAAAPPNVNVAVGRLTEDPFNTMAVQEINDWATGKTGWIKGFCSPALTNAQYTYSGTWATTSWQPISNLLAGGWCPFPDRVPDAVAGQRFFIMVKAYYVSGDGITVTWPQLASTIILV